MWDVIDQSLLLPESLLDFTYIPPFPHVGNSKSTGAENLGQIRLFSLHKNRGSVGEVS